MTSVSAIFLSISASLPVYVKHSMCYIHVIIGTLRSNDADGSENVA